MGRWALPARMPGRLLVFCGIPGSGKTTIARMVAKSDPLSVLVQTDAIRSMIPVPTFSAEESEMVYRSCVEVAKLWLDRGRLVILDGTFGSSRRREMTLSELSGHCAGVDIVYVVCDLQTALRRNSTRYARVPPERLEGIYGAFEVPDNALRINTSEAAPEAAAEMVVRSLLYPLVPPE